MTHLWFGLIIKAGEREWRWRWWRPCFTFKCFCFWNCIFSDTYFSCSTVRATAVLSEPLLLNQMCSQLPFANRLIFIVLCDHKLCYKCTLICFYDFHRKDRYFRMMDHLPPSNKKHVVWVAHNKEKVAVQEAGGAAVSGSKCRTV